MRSVHIFFSLVFLVIVWAPAPCRAEVQNMEITRQSPTLDIKVQYPQLGIATIDAELHTWAERVVQDFEQDFRQPEGDTPPPDKFLLYTSYTIEKPSSQAISIIFALETFTGGAHGMLDILVRTFDMETGLVLGLPFYFENVEIALNIMSTHSYEQLKQSLEDMYIEDMLRLGTTPDVDNFAAIALLGNGIRIYFPPYQVAPWAAGTQIVEIPLHLLEDAHPNLEWWGRAAPQK